MSARSASLALVFAMLVAIVADAVADPDPAYSLAYRRAVGYLRAQAVDAFEGEPGQGVLLAEVYATDSFAAGLRSTPMAPRRRP